MSNFLTMSREVMNPNDSECVAWGISLEKVNDVAARALAGNIHQRSARRVQRYYHD